MEKPNCYKCIHRRNVPGDAHSSCAHPKVISNNNTIFKMATTTFKSSAMELNIKANMNGVRNGWFLWPTNFDPGWLENCDGFEKIKE